MAHFYVIYGLGEADDRFETLLKSVFLIGS